MLGVLGGMGPMATVDFLRKLIKNTPGAHDQDHMPVVAFNIPQIPDRTQAILGVGDDPYPAMSDIIRRIEKVGADFIAIPCNTAHFWYDRMAASTRLPILHIVDAVVEALHMQGIDGGPIGVIATTGTIQSGIYSDRLSRHGFVSVLPGDQDSLMRGVHLAKAGYLDDAATVFRWHVEQLRAMRCRQVVLACTEIPLALDVAGAGAADCIDATDALARACVRFAAGATSRQTETAR